MNRSRRVRGWAAAAAVSVLTFGAAPDSAQAGTYTIDACANQDTGVAVAPPLANGGLPDGWSYASNNPTFELYRTQCTGTSDSFIGVRNNGRPLTGATSNDAQYAQLDFTAPDYTYIGDYTVWRQFNGADRTAGRTAMLFQHMINGISLEWRHCSFDPSCGLGVYGTPFAGSNAYHGNGAAAQRWKITLRSLCDADCDWGDFRLYAARVQLHDDFNPVFATDPAGSLTAATVLRGTVDTSMDLTDAGGGIHDVSVLFDGQVGTTETVTTGDCDAVQRSRTVPCPLSLSSSLSVDTTDIADGTYTVRVRARDAADNETRRAPWTITVDNGAPGAPQGLGSSAGSGWQNSKNTVDLSWTNPGPQVSPIEQARVTRCPAGTSSGCTTSTHSVTGSSPTVTGLSVPGEGAYAYTVQLIDAAGNTSASNVATTDVRFDATPPSSPERLAAVSRAETDPTVSATWSPPADPHAPIARARWELCRADGSECSSGEASADRLDGLRLPAEGDWRLSVRLVDAAGNIGAPATTTVTLKPLQQAVPQPAPTLVPGPLPTVTPTPPAAKRRPSLRITSARLTGTRLTLRGTLTRAATGRVTLTYEARIHGKRRRITRILPVEAGHFDASVRLSSTLRRAIRGSATIRYRGDARHTARSAKVTLKRR